MAGEFRFLAEKSAISENKARRFPATASYSNGFGTARTLHLRNTVTLRIESLAGEHGTTLRLIGRIQAEHLDELRRQIAVSASNALEMKEVTLVDADAVRFLGSCESEGVQLLNCSAYIREWIVRERESA
jgi:hypothetical protein